jgi:MFS family permease
VATVSVYGPAGLFSVALGAVAPMVPLLATNLGASPAVAAVVVGLAGLGQLGGDVPAAALALRLGDRLALMLAGLAAIGAFALCALAPSWPVLAAAVLASGFATAVFFLARQAHLIAVTPEPRRARALSAFGGLIRIGLLVGPFLGAGVIRLGGLRAPFWLAAGCALAAVAVVVATVPAGKGRGDRAARRSAEAPGSGFVRRHARVFLTLGSAILLIGAVRAVRVTALPLWSDHIGLSPETTSAIFGLAGLVESTLFYPSGVLMDVVGRLWVAVPSTAVMALGLMLLPLTGSAASAAAVAVLIGIGNGVGAGIVMTIGADAAPPDEIERFLGVWRLLTDTGGAVGPLLVTAGTAVAGLAIGVAAAGSTGLLAAAILWLTLPEHSAHARRRRGGAGGPGAHP